MKVDMKLCRCGWMGTNKFKWHRFVI